MEITEYKKKNSIVLELKGRLDTVTSIDLENKIQELMERPERQLVLDFSQLSYISSSGLRVLLMAAKRLKAVDGKMALVSLNDQNQAVFEIAGFSSVFTVYQSQDEAVNRQS
jgi:anti-sigma B factor antagonist